ncbi:hypothetical protein GUJ93_ZPchr0013g37874 [Zizania palustris]|uniref:Uncharacterized protein n=1 Tax=Zizania palustris TaxID=103762 RepID=A0A8J5X5N8_ZIZPA|nr:hypothetical protein GUJ93_ZPchr0013g37874 [Zizania palustris]
MNKSATASSSNPDDASLDLSFSGVPRLSPHRILHSIRAGTCRIKVALEPLFFGAIGHYLSEVHLASTLFGEMRMLFLVCDWEWRNCCPAALFLY